MDRLDLYLVGVGGQGVLTIADILLSAAMTKGIPCSYFPTKGMAQRGGFVKAQLRFGDASAGPEIPLANADVVISMELCESLKAVDYLKKGGDMLVFGSRFLPTEVMLGKAPYPDEPVVRAAAEGGGANYFFVDPSALPALAAANVFLLGAAQKHTAVGKLFTADELLSAVVSRFPKGADANKAAYAAGQGV